MLDYFDKNFSEDDQMYDSGPYLHSVDIDPQDIAPVDYPDYAKLCCEFVVRHKARGILICGTGIGMSIAANKCNGIRAARCVDMNDIQAAREHNDANVICLPEDFDDFEALEVFAYLKFKGEKEERHARRVQKMMDLEKLPEDFGCFPECENNG